mgnify:CR=1 FL=1
MQHTVFTNQQYRVHLMNVKDSFYEQFEYAGM